MAKIDFEDKVSLIDVPLPRKNKVTAEDMIEIKESVNALYPEKVVHEIDETTFFTVNSNVQYLPDLPVGKYYKTLSLVLKYKHGGTPSNNGTVAFLAIKRGGGFIALIDVISFFDISDATVDVPFNFSYSDISSGANIQNGTSWVNGGYSIESVDSSLLPALIASADGDKKIIIEHEYQIRDF